jgi:acyl-CoA thioesterase
MTEFDRTTTLTLGRPGELERVNGDRRRLTVELDETWASLHGVHGGYLTSLAVRAAEANLDGRPVRTITTSFLRPARPGEATIEVVPIRTGRSLTTLAVTMTQRERCVALARVTGATSTRGEQWDAPVDHDVPPLAECVEFTPPPGIRHFEHAEVRLDPATLPGGGGNLARVAGHVRPLEARPIDPAWLAMVLDWFPPAAFSRTEPPIGGVSVDYTVHVHRTLGRLGDEEWLTGVFTADVSHGGLALERGRLWAPDGRLVAESFHTRYTG